MQIQCWQHQFCHVFLSEHYNQSQAVIQHSAGAQQVGLHTEAGCGTLLQVSRHTGFHLQLPASTIAYNPGHAAVTREVQSTLLPVSVQETRSDKHSSISWYTTSKEQKGAKQFRGTVLTVYHAAGSFPSSVLSLHKQSFKCYTPMDEQILGRSVITGGRSCTSLPISLHRQSRRNLALPGMPPGFTDVARGSGGQ